MKKLKIAAILIIIFTLTVIPIYEGWQFIKIPENLLPGYRGEDVERMQQSLKNWGYYAGAVDGNYGWKTFLAVKDFQSSYGLSVNGIADSNTLSAMGFGSIGQAGSVYAQGRSIGNEQLLARAINGEARGEPYEGQVAVGAVIINRTRDAKFPKTIPGVIYQPGAFTAVSDGQINVAIDSKSTVVKAARDALNGWDPTTGCIYYWNPATATSKWIWSRKIVKKIGKHNFAK